GIMDALKIVFVTLFVDDGNFLGIRKEDANDGRVIFDMRAEIAERIGMPTFDDGIGFRRERAHCGAPSERERMRQVRPAAPAANRADARARIRFRRKPSPTGKNQEDDRRPRSIAAKVSCRSTMSDTPT